MLALYQCMDLGLPHSLPLPKGWVFLTDFNANTWSDDRHRIYQRNDQKLGVIIHRETPIGMDAWPVCWTCRQSWPLKVTPKFQLHSVEPTQDASWRLGVLIFRGVPVPSRKLARIITTHVKIPYGGIATTKEALNIFEVRMENCAANYKINREMYDKISNANTEKST